MRCEGAARLLQVAIDMLENPLFKKQPDTAPGSTYQQSPYRCELTSCEAAHRACIEAQALLRTPSPEQPK